MDWNSGILWGIIGLLGGFLISLLFYILGLSRKRLSYEIDTTPIISNKVTQVEDLKIQYKDCEIKDLFSSTIKIKNIGNTVIEDPDFASSAPLSVSTDGIFLVDKSNGVKLSSSTDANNIYPSFDIDEESGECSSIIVNFDYIPKRGKLTFSFFHTGDIILNGVLKDGKIIDAILVEKRSAFVSNVVGIAGGIISLILGLLSVIGVLVFQ